MAPRASTSNRVVAGTTKNAKGARAARDSSSTVRAGKKAANEDEEDDVQQQEEEEEGVTETQAEMAAVLKAFKCASNSLSIQEEG